MRKRHKITGLALGAAVVVTLATPASAGGLFEMLFGGFRQAARTVPAEITSSFADPFAGMRESSAPRGGAAPASGYCVRTCDGHYFPVHAQVGVSAAQMCSSFCPASETKVYSGGGIDNAVARDGGRYRDLPNAFVYRQKLVAGCTCNGKSAFGLAPVDVNSDPTLRQGDIVATANGLGAYTGGKNQTAEFTPISNYRSLPKSYRDKLAETKVAPVNPNMPVANPVSLRGSKIGDARRASNER
ncbi:MAG: DUF2865 domain-containing protein [Pseudolabrys sp.]